MGVCSDNAIMKLLTTMPKKYINENAELMKEWDWEANEKLSPEKLCLGSDKKVGWKCSKCGHRWEAAIKNRAYRSSKCPLCFGKFATPGSNDLATTHPELTKELHSTRNGAFSPSRVKAGSKEKVWWICSKCGYEWRTAICNRTLGGTSCPACTNSVLITGKNDLLATYPDIAHEWHPTKNGELNPSIVRPGSHYRAWLKCSTCGYEWQSTINNRTNHNSGCPKCKKSAGSIRGESDFYTTHPELAKEWHPTKNGSFSPKDIKAGSSKKVWWLCPNCGNEYESTIYSRVKGTGCPRCVYTNKTSYPEQALFYYLKQIYPDAINRYKASFLGKMELDIFIPSINWAIEYDGSAWHNANTLKKEQKKYQLCQKQNIKLIRVREKLPPLTSEVADYQLEVVKVNNKNNLEETIKQLLRYINFSRKYININLQQDEKTIRSLYQRKPKNSLYNLYPEIAKEWHPTKNGHLTPDLFYKGSEFRAWWKCSKCGYEWETTIKHRTREKATGCPACSNQILVPGVNDLATTHPNLAKEWHPTKNGALTPQQIITGMGKKFWWKCAKCGYEWTATIVHRKFSHSGCPKCNIKQAGERIRSASVKNNGSITDAKLIKEWDYERNYPLTPKDFPPASSKKVWWKCSKCGYRWQALISNRNISKTGCPVCKNTITVPGKNDLRTTHPDIAREWHPSKNTKLTPTTVRSTSYHKVWWKCSNCGHEWQAQVCRRTKGFNKCPYCHGLPQLPMK